MLRMCESRDGAEADARRLRVVVLHLQRVADWMWKMIHLCHWPECEKEVPPAMWGCKAHWFTLPKKIRDRIWATYVPGQEITKTPSAEYLDAALMARQFAEGKRR